MDIRFEFSMIRLVGIHIIYVQMGGSEIISPPGALMSQQSIDKQDGTDAMRKWTKAELKVDYREREVQIYRFVSEMYFYKESSIQK